MRSGGIFKYRVSGIQIKMLHFVIITIIIGSLIYEGVNKSGLCVIYLYLIRVKQTYGPLDELHYCHSVKKTEARGAMLLPGFNIIST